jgi:hypothetical protein
LHGYIIHPVGRGLFQCECTKIPDFSKDTVGEW